MTWHAGVLVALAVCLGCRSVPGPTPTPPVAKGIAVESASLTRDANGLRQIDIEVRSSGPAPEGHLLISCEVYDADGFAIGRFQSTVKRPPVGGKVKGSIPVSEQVQGFRIERIVAKE
jgi:hypothetical protein